MNVNQRAPMTERIMAAADRLFYQKGIRAVGVDAVAAEAGISKRSLYDTYPSKDVLVAEYLKRRIVPLPQSDAPPLQQVLGLFDLLHARFTEDAFRGCPFVNAVTELAEDCETARTMTLAVKEERRQHIKRLLDAAGIDGSETLASHIALLLEGTYPTMLVRKDPNIATQGREAARVLIRAAGGAV